MKYKINIELVEIEENSFHILITSTFSNDEKGNWIIDTGASKTVFDINQSDLFSRNHDEDLDIKSAGISEGPIETGLGELYHVSFHQFKLDKLDVALIDLSHINEMYQKYVNRPICGLIGSDFLNEYKAVINYKKKTLVLRK